MRKIIFLFILVCFIGFLPAGILAEEEEIQAGLLPDSPFYFLKTWKESIQMFFTFGEENKAKQFLHLADVRLAEYQKMIDKGKTEIAQKTLEKYEKQLNHALEKADQVQEKGKDVEKLKEEIGEKILKHQEVLNSVLEKVPEQAKEGVEKAIEMSQRGFENAIQAVSGEKKEELEKKAEEVKSRIEEKLEAGPAAPVQPKPISSPGPNTSLPWAMGTFQAEFPSFFLTGQPTIMRSPGSPMPQPVAEQKPTLKSMNDDEWCAKKRMRVDDYGVKYILEMLGVVTVKVGSVDCGACYIRKFSEDGILVAERWDDMYLWYLQKLSGKWACEKSVNYKNFMGEWVDYYQISESWSPQNFYYQCVKREGAYVSGNADYCEKDVPATAILPSPTVTSPTPVSSDVLCQRGKMEDYKCPNSSLIKWQCQCRDESTEDEWRSCAVNPAESCPLSVSSPSLTINSIQTRYSTWEQGRPGEAKSISMRIFWKTNKPTTSWIEYGLTTAYGSKVSSYTPSPDYEHGTYDFPIMQRNTTYYFRIIAEDAQGNKIVSDDYTFTTGL